MRNSVTIVIAFIVSLSPIAITFARAGDPFPNKQTANVVEPRVQFGSYGDKAGELNDPTAIAVTNQEILIAECHNNRVQTFDFEGHSKRIFSGEGEGQLNCPQGIAVDEDGNIIVSESRGRIVIFSGDTKFIRAFGRDGVKYGELGYPTNLTASRGLIYVTEVANNRVQVFDYFGNSRRVIGYGGNESGAFIMPRSVAVDDRGAVYVVDALHRVQKFMSDGSVKSWGAYGGMPGQLAEPSDISIAEKKVFVADTVNHRLQGFDEDGNLLVVWGRHPEIAHEGRGHTHYPTSLKVSPDGKYGVVCEAFEYRCQIFDMVTVRTVSASNGNAWWEKFPRFHYGSRPVITKSSMMNAMRISLSAKFVQRNEPTPNIPREILIVSEPDLNRVVTFAIDTPAKQMVIQAATNPSQSVDIPVMHSIGQFGTSPGKFTMISGTQPTVAGTLLVADGGQNNIQEFDLLTGAYIRTLFGPGTGLGQFRGPSGMEQTPDGFLFVADFHNNRLQIFDREYNALVSFGRTGRGMGEFFSPLSLSFDPKYEKLFVTDSGNSRVVMLGRQGTTLSAAGVIGRRARPGEWGNGTFLSPFGVAVGPKGDIYVSDQDLQLIQKFDSRGQFVKQWGGWGADPGQFYKPKGVSVDQDGNVYVIDFGNHRGQIFDENGKFLAIFGEGILYPPQSARGKSVQ